MEVSLSGIIVRIEDEKTGEPINVRVDVKNRSITRYYGEKEVTISDFSDDDLNKILKVVDSVEKAVKDNQPFVDLLSSYFTTDKNADKKVSRSNS